MELSLERSFVLPAARGKAVRLEAGQRLKLTNPHGTQAVDFWAFADGDTSEYLSVEHLRSVNSTIHASIATALVSNRRRPIAAIVEDTSSGRHDTLLCPCNRDLYRQLGAEDHRSCADNMHEGLAEIGIAVPFTPGSVNLFMAVDVLPGGAIDRLLPTSKPGAHVMLRAEIDAVFAFSNCPQDITTINGPDRTPRDCLIEILPPAAVPA